MEQKTHELIAKVLSQGDQVARSFIIIINKTCIYLRLRIIFLCLLCLFMTKKTTHTLCF